MSALVMKTTVTKQAGCFTLCLNTRVTNSFASSQARQASGNNSAQHHTLTINSHPLPGALPQVNQLLRLQGEGEEVLLTFSHFTPSKQNVNLHLCSSIPTPPGTPSPILQRVTFSPCLLSCICLAALFLIFCCFFSSLFDDRKSTFN